MKAMLIAIEAERANIDNPTGVEHYARQLILALAEIDRQNDYILYLRTAPQPWILELPKNFKYKVMPFPFAWTQLRVSWEIIWHRPDALFIPASALPLIHPANSVVTIHDLAWDKFPEMFDFKRLWFLRLFNWFIARNARKIIAISEQTKTDLINKYKIDPRRIEVIYHGFNIDSEGERADALEQQKIAALPEGFILYLGTLQPRKNPQGLIDAFNELRREGKINQTLVIAGGKGWLYQEIMKKIAQSKDVIYFGYVNARLTLLRKAGLLVNPSFYEGFGLQALDAFACGVPVASSRAPAMPEVCGDAAEYFDPDNKEQIKTAILNIINNPERRGELVEKGHTRLKMFTWKKCAEQTLRLISRK